MSYASEAMERIKLSERPYGYLFIYGSDLRGLKYPVSECELYLTHEGAEMILAFLVFDYDRLGRKYSISVFSGNDCMETRRMLLNSIVKSNGGDVVSIQHETAIVDARFGDYHDLLVRALHVWVHDYVITHLEIPEYEEFGSTERRYPITAERFTQINRSSPLGIPDMISLVNHLLHL